MASGVLGTIVPEHPCYFGRESLERLLRGNFSRVATEANRATIRALASFPCLNTKRDGSSSILATDVVRTTALRIGKWMRQMRYTTVQEAVDSEVVDIFGANTCTLELIAAGAIRTEQVDKVYDDDPRRWGKHLVNTDLVVSPRETLKKKRRTKIIVCSYTHRHYIADYITSTGNIPIKLYGDDE